MINAPTIKLFVESKYITGTKGDRIPCYLMGIDARENQHLRFTVYLNSGAIWSGLPIEALRSDRIEETQTHLFENHELQPFSCLDGAVSVLTYKLLMNANVKTSLGEGRYLFTINYQGIELSDDPEQYKTHNIIAIDNGQVCAFPNNMIRIIDTWFGSIKEDVSNYKRTQIRYMAGG
jgi:hypothetical protein